MPFSWLLDNRAAPGWRLRYDGPRRIDLCPDCWRAADVAESLMRARRSERERDAAIVRAERAERLCVEMWDAVPRRCDRRLCDGIVCSEREECDAISAMRARLGPAESEREG
jgi:hypothetical protein